MEKVVVGSKPPFEKIPPLKDSVSEVIRIIGDGEIGGKARGLIFLAEHADELGYKVPKTVVLASGFFNGVKMMEKYYTNQYELMVPRPVFSEAMRAKLRQVLGQFDGLVALRSSASFEDAELSAAGICATNYLNASKQYTEEQKLEAAEYFISEVFVSAWERDALAFRKKHNLPEPKMSVILQELVGPKFSFEGFAPAVSGIVDTAYMNNVSLRFCNGFGTRAVRKASANSRIYSRELKLLKSEDVTKEFDFWSVNSNGLRLNESERNYLFDRKKMNENSAAFVAARMDRKLAELALELSARFGKPIELEFALASPEGPAHLVQARRSKAPEPAPEFPEIADVKKIHHSWGGAISGTGVKRITEIIDTTHWCDTWGGNFDELERINESHKGYLLLLSTLASASTSDLQVKYHQFYNAAAVIEIGMHMEVGLEHFSRICRDSDIFYMHFEGFDDLGGRRFKNVAEMTEEPFVYKTDLTLIFDEEKGKVLIYRND